MASSTCWARTGRECWLRGAYAPVRDETGRSVKAVLFGADVTQSIAERDAMEGERRQTHEEQGALIGTLAENLRRVAEGDLTAVIDAEFKGATRPSRTTSTSAIRAMRDAMRGIAEAGGSLRNGSGEIAHAPTTCPSAPSSRPPAWKRPPRRSIRSPPPSSAAPKAPTRPPRSLQPPGSAPSAPARWCARRSRP